MTRFVSALNIAQDIRSGKRSAASVMQAVLATIRTQDSAIRSVTHLFAEQAMQQAHAVDAQLARKETLPPLAGVPFGVKDLFDIKGHVTTAGSIVLRNTPGSAGRRHCWPPARSRGHSRSNAEHGRICLWFCNG